MPETAVRKRPSAGGPEQEPQPRRPAKRIFRPLTDEQWRLARLQFETSDEKTNLKSISVLFKTSLSAVQKRSAREQWSKGAQIVAEARDQLQRATSDALAVAAQKAAVKVTDKLMDDLAPFIEAEKRRQIQRAVRRSKRGQKRLDRVSKGFQVYDSKRGVVVDLEPAPKDEMHIAAAEDKYDQIIRRNLGMESSTAAGGPINFNFLCNQAAVSVSEKP